MARCPNLIAPSVFSVVRRFLCGIWDNPAGEIFIEHWSLTLNQ
ncbi:hypothetical protein LSH36_845g01010 [Paralvinella palmiformis]|uniref:Uncharacterized protein n=1 Tax=Paralvinella palmiformis TaxID=53620 RepID=A0AAD9IZX9_9ANNE|nr:hypothetical protein LSH36_845g01010 [Paralvinella palmiformis]